MKKQLVIIGIVAILVSVGLSGCVDDRSKFVGVWKVNGGETVGIWERNEITIVFFSNGTLSAYDINGTWEIKDSLLDINLDEEYLTSPQDTFSFKFSNFDRTLTITDINTGRDIVFIKQ